MMPSSTDVVQYGLMALVAAVIVQRALTKIIAQRKIPWASEGRRIDR